MSLSAQPPLSGEDILNAIPALVVTFGEDGRIRYENLQWREWFGRILASEGEPWWRALEDGPPREELLARWRAHQTGQLPLLAKVHLRGTPAPHERWHLVRISALPTNGEKEWCACFMEAQGLLTPTSSLASLLPAFATEMATSVFTVLGWIRLFRAGQPSLNSEMAWTLGVLEKCAEAQSALVSDVRELNYLRQKRRRLTCHNENLAALAETALEAARPAAEAAGLRLKMQAESPDLCAHVDAKKLARSLGEILQSAIRHTNRGGTVTLNVARRHRGVAIEVSDTGVGLSRTNLEALLGPDPAAGRLYIGAVGLKLALATGYVELHGGHVEVHSPGPNRGTTFTICLPESA